MRMVSPKGIEADLSLDFDKVVAYEREHPDWSLIDEMRGVERMRFSSLDLLASFVYDGGWKSLARDGFTMDQLSEALMEGMRELGFTSAGRSEE